MRYEKEDKRGNVNVSSVEVGSTGYNRILSLIITQRILMNKKYADQENSYAFYPQISTVPQNRRLRRVPQPPSPPDLPSPPLAPRRRRFSLRFWQIPVLDGTEELGSVVPIHLGGPFPRPRQSTRQPADRACPPSRNFPRKLRKSVWTRPPGLSMQNFLRGPRRPPPPRRSSPPP